MFTAGFINTHINVPSAKFNFAKLTHSGQGMVIEFILAIRVIITIVGASRFFSFQRRLGYDQGKGQQIIQLRQLLIPVSFDAGDTPFLSQLEVGIIRGSLAAEVEADFGPPFLKVAGGHQAIAAVPSRPASQRKAMKIQKVVDSS